MNNGAGRGWAAAVHPSLKGQVPSLRSAVAFTTDDNKQLEMLHSFTNLILIKITKNIFDLFTARVELLKKNCFLRSASVPRVRPSTAFAAIDDDDGPFIRDLSVMLMEVSSIHT